MFSISEITTDLSWDDLLSRLPVFKQKAAWLPFVSVNMSAPSSYISICVNLSFNGTLLPFCLTKTNWSSAYSTVKFILASFSIIDNMTEFWILFIGSFLFGINEYDSFKETGFGLGISLMVWIIWFLFGVRAGSGVVEGV